MLETYPTVSLMDFVILKDVSESKRFLYNLLIVSNNCRATNPVTKQMKSPVSGKTKVTFDKSCIGNLKSSTLWCSLEFS